MAKKKAAKKRKPAKKKTTNQRARSPKKALPEMDAAFDELLAQLLPNQKKFLVAYYEEGEVAPAVAKIGVSRQAHYGVWMAKDPDNGEPKYPLYYQMFTEARASLVELAEGVLWKSGVKGIEEPLVHQGKLTNVKVLRRDTTALIFWLKNNSKKYRERSSVEGPEGEPLGIGAIPLEVARDIAARFDKQEAKKGKGK